MKSVVVAAGVFASLVLASSANADPISYGSVDSFFDSYDKNTECGGLNLAKCEEAKIALAAGVNVDYVDLKSIDTTGSDWVSVNDYDPLTNLVAFDLSLFGSANPTVVAFAVKIGNVSGADDFYVFVNNPSSRYALIDLNEISPGITADKISHISIVPEPGSLSLVVTALVGGLGVASARRFRSARHKKAL